MGHEVHNSSPYSTRRHTECRYSSTQHKMRAGGSGQLHTLTALPLGIYQLVPTQQKDGNQMR